MSSRPKPKLAYDAEITVPKTLRAHRLAYAIQKSIQTAIPARQPYHLRITFVPLSYNAMNWLYPGMPYAEGISQAFDFPINPPSPHVHIDPHTREILFGQAAMLTADCMTACRLKIGATSGINHPSLPTTAIYHNEGNSTIGYLAPGTILQTPENGFLHRPGAISFLIGAGPLEATFMRIFVALAGNNQRDCTELIQQLPTVIDEFLHKQGDFRLVTETF